MGLETRNGRGSYYTRSYRDCGTVRREYHGSGALADLLASLVEDERNERALEAEAWCEEKSSALEREAPLIRLDEAIDDLLAATLTAAGYHRHNYGKWRKKRGTHENIPRADLD
jgi:hypothetical protein